MNYDILDDNVLIITPYKKQFLKYISENKILKNIKLLTLNEFKEYIFFKYDEKAIYYIMKKYNTSYFSAISYLESMYYCEEDIENDKIKFLLKIKKELDNNKLLKYKNIKYKKIVIFGYEYIDSYYIKKIQKYNIEFVNYNYKNNKIENAYCLNNIYEEVSFVADKIVNLLRDNININNIKLINLNDIYRNEVRKVFSLYNIPFEDVKISLYELPIIKQYLKNMDISVIEKNSDIYQKLVNLINKYAWSNNLFDIKELLIEDLKRTYINKNYINEVKEENIDNICEYDYVFLLNYHIDSIPKIYKDIDFISDNIKKIIGADTVEIRNKQLRIETLNKIKNINNLYITCNKNNYISNLIESLEFKTYEKNYDKSNVYNNYDLGLKLDTYYKYGLLDNDIKKLYKTYHHNYNIYDNNYKLIDINKFNKYIKNQYMLSYTKLDTYNRCSFKFYLNYILKIDKYEETFKIFVGNISHYILSICFNNDFDLDIEFNKYIESQNRVFSNKEQFFLKKIKEELKFIIETIKEQNKFISLDSTLYENKIVIKNQNRTFEGIIDKLLYNQENMAIIDYKTGIKDLNMKNIKYGIDMQLPIYVYLSKNKFPKKNISGFYLQHILNNEGVIEENYLDTKKNNLKLQGYSNSNIEILKSIDNNYQDSKLIKGMKYSTNGFYKYTKVLSNTEIDELSKLSKIKIDECFDNIFKAKFDINPKIISDKNISCEYCKYKDICFKTSNNNIYIDGSDDIEMD